VSAGYPVVAIVRRPEAAGAARACGADIRIADIFDVASMAAALTGCDVGINLATTLPGPSGRGDFAANDRLRIEGAPNWIAACAAAGVGRVIQQSIAMLNASGDASWTDETHIHQPAVETTATRAFAAALAMEAVIAASPIDWIILRGGLFYGPGTGFDHGWRARSAAAKLRLPGDGSDYVSLCHITDMAAATLAAIRRWPSRDTLIVCDDEPAPWRNVFGFIAMSAGHEPPSGGGPIGFPSFRLRNARARAALDWAPHYDSYRTGLAQ
jgi:nucleoside-diphosphate-sugar epimerase